MVQAPPVESTYVQPTRLAIMNTPVAAATESLHERGRIYPNDSGKSKPKDRLREYASGGSLSANKAAEILHDGTVHGKPITDKQRRYFGYVSNHSTGGDVQLSDTAFQVKGHANVTDGNEYHMGNQQVNLDNNEVVDKNFVYSNKLKMASGGTFAQAAAKLEKGKGNAEKTLKTNPNDPHAQKTKEVSEHMLKSLAKNQEAMASMAGLRNPDGSTKQNMNAHYAAMGGTLRFADGGPGDPSYVEFPSANKPWMDMMGGQHYYDPYNNRYMIRHPLTGEYHVSNLNNNKDFQDFGAPQNFRNSHAQEIEAHLQKYPNNPNYSPATSSKFPSLTTEGVSPVPGQDGTLWQIPPSNPVAAPAARVSSLIGGNYTPPPRGGGRRSPSGGPYTVPDQGGATESSPMMAPIQPLDSSLSSQTVTSNAKDSQMAYADKLRGLNMSSTSTRNSNLRPGFTSGDALETVDLISKFAQLAGGPEKATPFLDNTPITKTSYDVRPTLYNNQRQLQNSLSGVDTSSPIVRRALANQMYAQKINADSGALAKYQEMNNQATTQYEDRLSNQRRFNSQQSNLNYDINARNRGTYNQVLQNSFTSLGNFGQALNTRKTSYDALNILKTQYPKVYAQIYGAIQ